MTLHQKALLIMTGSAAALALAFSFVRIDGDFRPIEPLLTLRLSGSAAWFPVAPVLVSNAEDLDAIFVVRPDSARGREFDAVRVDLATGRQTPASVPLGPDSPYRPFVPGEVSASVAGLRFDRPVFHLFTLPDGKGPGFHWVDSATGKIEFVLHWKGADRPILEGSGVNTSRLLELASRVFVDPERPLAAVTIRKKEGLDLHVFAVPSPSADPGSAGQSPKPTPAT